MRAQKPQRYSDQAPTTQFDLSRAVVLSIAQLLCRKTFSGGDLGDPQFAREMNDEVVGGRRQMWLRDHRPFLDSVLQGMGYDCSEGSLERKAVEQKGSFKVRLKGSGSAAADAANSNWQADQKNFHADEDDPGCLRVVCVLWGPRTWFLKDSKVSNDWLRKEVVDRIRTKRRTLTKLQLSKAKKVARGKSRKLQLGFTVNCVVAGRQCAPVIEPFGKGWDTVSCRKVVGRTLRPTQLIHAVPTTNEVEEFGFGIPGTTGLLQGVEGEIRRIVVVLDGLPTPAAWGRGDGGCHESEIEEAAFKKTKIDISKKLRNGDDLCAEEEAFCIKHNL